MSRRGYCLVGLLAVAAAGGWAATGVPAETADFARYQVILDRSPFGSVAGAGAAEAGPGWSSDFVFMGRIMLTNRQVLAVILRKSANRSYYKAEGESIEDVKVVRIESGPPASKLVLQRGLETARLDYLPAGTAPPVALAAPPPGQPMTPVPPSGAPTIPTTPTRRMPFRREAL